MPSPFPGMDPYLEGPRWPGFHFRFLAELDEALMPRVRPKYVVYVEERVYVEHLPPENGRLIRPDLTLAAVRPPEVDGGGTAVLTAPVIVPVAMPERIRERRLELQLERGPRQRARRSATRPERMCYNTPRLEFGCLRHGESQAAE